MQALPEEKQVTEKKETERRIENKSFNKFHVGTCTIPMGNTHTFQSNQYFAMRQMSEYQTLAVADVLSIGQVFKTYNSFSEGVKFRGIRFRSGCKNKTSLKYSLTITGQTILRKNIT